MSFKILWPANKHDKTLFAMLFGEMKKTVTFDYFTKYLANSVYDAIDIKEQLIECGIVPVISKKQEGIE